MNRSNERESRPGTVQSKSPFTGGGSRTGGEDRQPDRVGAINTPFTMAVEYSGSHFLKPARFRFRPALNVDIFSRLPPEEAAETMTVGPNHSDRELRVNVDGQSVSQGIRRNDKDLGI